MSELNGTPIDDSLEGVEPDLSTLYAEAVEPSIALSRVRNERLRLAWDEVGYCDGGELYLSDERWRAIADAILEHLEDEGRG